MTSHTDHHRSSGGFVLAVLLAGVFISNVDLSIVNVAAPSIHRALGASGAQLELVVSGYILAYAMLQITGARLGRIYGPRRLYLLGLAAFTLASLACGLAPEPPMLIVARVVQGVGAAAMVPQVLTGIQLYFSGRTQARALGLYPVALSASAVCGQIFGGAFVSADIAGASWRPIFLINVPVGLVVFVIGLRVLPHDRRQQREPLDLVGVGILAAALLLVVLPLALGRTEGWPLWIWSSLTASAPLLAGFTAHEHRVKNRGGHPLVDLVLLRGGATGLGLLSLACASMTYISLLFALALYLQQGLGHSALYSGLALVSWVTAFGLVGPLIGRVSDATARRLAPLGGLILGGAYAGIGLANWNTARAGTLLFVLLGVGGAGLGLNFSAILRHLTSSVPVTLGPDLSGLIGTVSQVAGAVGVAAFGTLYFATASHPDGAHTGHAFALVSFALAAVGAVAAVAAALAVRPTAMPIRAGAAAEPMT